MSKDYSVVPANWLVQNETFNLTNCNVKYCYWPVGYVTSMEISEAKNPEKSWCTYEIKPGVDLWRLSGSPDYISIARIYVWRIEYPRRSSGLHHYPTSDITRGVVVWSERFVAKLVKSCTRDRIGRSSLVVTLGVSSDLQSSMFIGIRLKKNCGMKKKTGLTAKSYQYKY
ncbi:hypothetical protein QTP88_010183 [Uroleucon formosanum]